MSARRALARLLAASPPPSRGGWQVTPALIEPETVTALHAVIFMASLEPVRLAPGHWEAELELWLLRPATEKPGPAEDLLEEALTHTVGILDAAPWIKIRTIQRLQYQNRFPAFKFSLTTIYEGLSQ